MNLSAAVVVVTLSWTPAAFPGSDLAIAGAGLMQYASDAAYVAGDYGNFLLGVRNESMDVLVNAEDRYGPFGIDRYGRIAALSSLMQSEVSVTPTLDTVGAYAAGNSLHTADLTFAGMARYNGGSGTITAIRVKDKEAKDIGGELWLFNAALASTTHTARNAWNLADADVGKYVTHIPFGRRASSSNNIVHSNEGHWPYVCGGSSTSLIGVAVVAGAATWTATDSVEITLVTARD